MKLIAYIKLTMVAMVKNLGIYLFVFALFPLLLSGLLAYFQSDVFTPKVVVSRMEISIVDRDRTEYSGKLKSFFENNRLKNIILVKPDSEEIKYRVLIPSGYEEKLKNSKQGNISIIVKAGAPESSALIIGQLVDKYNDEVSEQLLILNKLDKRPIGAKQKLKPLENIDGEIAAAYANGTEAIKSNIVRGKRTLSSYEYYSVTFVGFALIMLIMSLAASVYVERENGMYGRILSTAIKKQEYFNYNLITSLIFAVIINFVYVFAYRLAGLSFQGSIPILSLIVLCQSILAVSLMGFLVAFVNRKASTFVMNAILILQVVVGGTFFPIGKMGKTFVLDAFSNFSPDVLITKAYKSFIIYNNFGDIKNYLLGMLLISIGLYVVSIVKVTIKWGE